MFPILVLMYVRLARREEREALAKFGDAYARYAAATPAFSHGSSHREQRTLPAAPRHNQLITSWKGSNSHD